MPVVQPFDPLWPDPTSVPRFNETYALVAAARFPLHDSKPEKIRVGEPLTRVCALCGRSRQDGATFRNESHIIPAALGNRRYVSNEECDDCNEEYSRSQDMHLVNALAFQRLFFGVKGRDRYIGLKPRGNSEIRTSGKNQLQIVRGKDEGVQFELIGEHEGRIAFELPSYMPMGMLQAMLRSAWLLSPFLFRQHHEYLRRWIKDCAPVPTRLLQYSLDDIAFAFVELDLWKLTRPQTESSALLLRLVFANIVLVWPLPERTGEQKPCLIPPFLIGQKKPGVSMMTIKDPLQRVEMKPELHFSYESRVSHQELDLTLASKPPSVQEPITRVPVELRAIVNGLPGRTVQSFMTLRHQDPLRTHLRIQGGDLAANIGLEIDHRTDKVHAEIALLPTLLPASKALASVHLLIDASGNELSIGIIGAKEQSLRVSTTIDGDFLPVRGILQILERISEALAVDLRYPDRGEELDLVSLLEAEQIAKSGVVENGAGTVTLTGEDGTQFREHLARAPGTTVVSEHAESSLAVAGHVIQLGRVKREFVNARLCFQDDPTDVDHVLFECDVARDTYLVWKARADARRVEPMGTI